MNKVLLGILGLSFALPVFAQVGWNVALQNEKGSAWQALPSGSTGGNAVGFMERQCVLYFELKRPNPHAVKLTAPGGAETVYVCSDVRAAKQGAKQGKK